MAARKTYIMALKTEGNAFRSKTYVVKEGKDANEVLQRCKAKWGAKGIQAIKLPGKPKSDLACLQMANDSGKCWTIDGCVAEPDGSCQHGLPSWLLVRGLI